MARFLTKNRVLFQHIPRTGGSWVEKAIDLCGIRRIGWLEKQPLWLPRKHCLLSHYHRREMGRVKWVFAFVRHPLSYYESTWKWLNKAGDHGSSLMKRWDWHPHASAAKEYQPDFNDWVLAMLNRHPTWYTRLVESYVGPPGGEFCDFIGRTERLKSDFVNAMSLLGYGECVLAHGKELRNMKRINVIKKSLEWNSLLMEEVLSTERLVIERFYRADITLGRVRYASLAPRHAEELDSEG